MSYSLAAVKSILIFMCLCSVNLCQLSSEINPRSNSSIYTYNVSIRKPLKYWKHIIPDTFSVSINTKESNFKHIHSQKKFSTSTSEIKSTVSSYFSTVSQYSVYRKRSVPRKIHFSKFSLASLIKLEHYGHLPKIFSAKELSNELDTNSQFQKVSLRPPPIKRIDSNNTNKNSDLIKNKSLRSSSATLPIKRPYHIHSEYNSRDLSDEFSNGQGQFSNRLNQFSNRPDQNHFDYHMRYFPESNDQTDEGLTKYLIRNLPEQKYTFSNKPHQNHLNYHKQNVTELNYQFLKETDQTHHLDYLTRDLPELNDQFFSRHDQRHSECYTKDEPSPHSSTEYSNSTNCSTGDHLDQQFHAPTFQNSTLTKGVILGVLATLALVANVSTLTSIVRTGRLTTSTVYMLLCQLAMADLMVTLFCILTESIWTLAVQWHGGNILCKLIKFMQMFSLYLSTFVLVLIGFDRLWAVRYPMQRSSARKQVRRGILLIWILSGIFSAPQVAIFRVVRGPFVEEFHQCVTYGFYSALWQEQLYTTLTLVLMFLLPLLILISTYVTTFFTIAGRKNTFSERISQTPIDDARYKILHKAKVKSLMLTVVIVLTFVVCWTPYYVMMVIFMFLEPDDQLAQDLQSGIFFFGSSTSLLNPIIYGAFHLRPRKKRKTQAKTASFCNSNSCRVDNSAFREIMLPRNTAIHMHVNGNIPIDCLEMNAITSKVEKERHSASSL